MNKPRRLNGSMLVAALVGSLLVCGAAAASTGTVLLVVANSASLNAQESAKKTLLEGWGYTVTPISATATQANFDSSCQTSSCAYISETILSTNLGTKLVATTIPVIDDESALSDEFGFSSTYTDYSAVSVYITNTTHYITSTFAAGSLTIANSNQPLHYASGTLGGITTLAKQTSTTGPTLVLLERLDALSGGGTAAGRRVYLPWGSTGLDITALNANGQTMMKRTIEWALLPVSHWKLDDGSGSTAVDWIGGRNGTISGATWTTGKIAGGLKFNGATDYCQIADNPAFRVTKALTVAGWIKGAGAWPSGSLVCLILRKGDDNPNNWEFSIANGHVELLLDGNDGTGTEGNTTLTTGVWHHVAGTWDGSTVRVYLDGVLDKTPATYASALGTDTRPVYLGGRTTNTDVTNGIVDDVRFYNRALTAAEIAAMAKASPTITSWSAVAP